MFGGMEELQQQMQSKLTEIKVQAEAGDGLVIVTANAARQILDIKLDPELSDKEEIEDLVLEAVNRVIVEAAKKEKEETQRMISQILPPGMDNLGGLFG